MNLKLYRAVLRTAGKTDDQIKAGFAPTIPAQREIDLARATYEMWDGLECMVTDSSFGEAGAYSFLGAMDEEGLKKEKEATYLMEQDEMFGTYINDREGFDRDFDSGEYSPDACFIFRGDEIEIIAEIPPRGRENGGRDEQNTGDTRP